jgi:hypothetical protein
LTGVWLGFLIGAWLHVHAKQHFNSSASSSDSSLAAPFVADMTASPITIDFIKK